MRSIRILVAFLAIVAFSMTASATTIYHVRTDGHDNAGGQSWYDALQTIDEAVSRTVPGDEIWVGQGVYPAGLAMPSGVKIIGCFSEDGSYGPDPENYQSTIQGWVSFFNCAAGTILQGFNIDYVGSEVVYIIGGNAVLQDCTIGRAYWTIPEPQYGYFDNSVRCENGNTTLERCMIVGGPGGMYFSGSSLTMNDVMQMANVAGASVFCDNVNISGYSIEGAAGYYDEQEAIDLRYSLYIHGRSGNINISGLQIFSSQAPFVINDCQNINISNSTFYYCGSGAYSSFQITSDNSNVTINDISMSENGGSEALIRVNSGSMTLSGGSFSSNNTNSDAGILRANYGSTVKLRSCRIDNNTCTYGAGAIYNYNASLLEVTNCLLTSNTGNQAGAINNLAGTLSVINSTICGNHSTANAYGGIRLQAGAATVGNSILYGNCDSGNAVTETSQLYKAPAVNLNLTHCMISGYPQYLTGTDNFGTNPVLAAGYHLGAGSPCFNTGDNSLIPSGVTKDLDGEDRIQQINVDRGCFEDFRNADTWYVSNSGSDYAPNDGTSWIKAFATIEKAGSVAKYGDTIKVAEGSYPEFVAAKNGVKLLAGFSGTTDADPDPWSYYTTIDGVGFAACGSDTLVSGFTMEGYGLLVWMFGGNPTLKDCTVGGPYWLDPEYGHDCTIYVDGGTPNIVGCAISSGDIGIDIRNAADPSIDGCSINSGFVGLYFGTCTNIRIKDTTLGELAGSQTFELPYAIYFDPSCTGTTTMDNLTIMSTTVPIVVSNSAMNMSISGSMWQGAGPGIDGLFKFYSTGNLSINGLQITGCESASPLMQLPHGKGAISGCSFLDNYVVGTGGIIQVGSGGSNELTVSNCRFQSNHVTGNGVVSAGSGSKVTLRSCEFSGNQISGFGGAIYNNSGMLNEVSSCLITDNISQNAGGAIYCYLGTINVCNSTIARNKSVTTQYGGVLSMNSRLTLDNSILYWNVPLDSGSPTLTSQILTIGGNVTKRYNDIQLCTPDAYANNNGDPCFRSATDYRLAWGSPCINTGLDAYVPAGVTTDLDGRPRILSGRVDKGAYEWLNLKVYAGTGGPEGGRVYQYQDGYGWRTLPEVNPPSLGTAVLCLAEFDRKLYAGVIDETGLPKVYCYNEATGQWLIAGDGLPNAWQVSSMAVSTDASGDQALYAGTGSSMLWRLNGSAWEAALDYGFGDGVESLFGWRDLTYLGERNTDNIGTLNWWTGQLQIYPRGGSCIYDFQPFGTATLDTQMFASAEASVIYHESANWSPVDLSPLPSGPSWEMDVWNGQIWASSETYLYPSSDGENFPSEDRKEMPNWTVNDELQQITAMTSCQIGLLVGSGRELSYNMVGHGPGRVYFFDGSNFSLIGNNMGDGVQVMIHAGTTYYVKPTGNNQADGLTWDTAVRTIQRGIDKAFDGDTVMVATGTYTGDGNRDISFGGKAITLTSTDPDSAAVVAATVINCQSSGGAMHRCFIFNNNESCTSVLKGFTITGGYMKHADGAAILCSGASPTITRCVISGNMVRYGHGAGIANVDGAGTRLVRCQLSSNNSVQLPGGAVYNSADSKVRISRCEFAGNWAPAGAAIYNNGCDSGTGIGIRNSVFRGNGAGAKGKAIRNDASNVALTNCTFTGNIGEHVMTSCNGSQVTVTNSIFWDNVYRPKEISGNLGNPTTVTYSDVKCGLSPRFNVTGSNNIDAPPLFTTYGYYLTANSPCIDMGDSGPNYGRQTDFRGRSRVVDIPAKGNTGNAIDMGADEYQP